MEQTGRNETENNEEKAQYGSGESRKVTRKGKGRKGGGKEAAEAQRGGEIKEEGGRLSWGRAREEEEGREGRKLQENKQSLYFVRGGCRPDFRKEISLTDIRHQQCGVEGRGRSERRGREEGKGGGRL